MTSVEKPKKDTSLELGEKSIFSLLVRYAVPSVIGMVVQILYNLVDAAVVGNFVGGAGLAAVTMVFPIQIFSAGFGLLIGVGSCSCVAILLGQRKLKEAEHVLSNAFTLILITSSIMIVSLLVLGHWYISQCAPNAEVDRMARVFLNITTIFGFLPPIIFGLNNIIRAQGNPHIAMATLILSSILNVILNPIFVGQFSWGVEGSAWATVISQAVTALWVVLFFRGSHSLLKLRLSLMAPRWQICKPILQIGLAPFLTQSTACLQGMLLMGLLSHYGGETALTVWGVIYRLVSMTFMVTLGIYQGAQPIIGYNYGARQFDRVLRTLRCAIWVATFWCTPITLIALLFPDNIVQIFTPLTPELALIAPMAIRVCLSMMCLLGFQVISSHYFQAVGKPWLATFLSLTRQVIFLIPLLFLLPWLFEHMGQTAIFGVWSAFPTADVLSCLLTAIFYAKEVWELKSGNVKYSKAVENLNFT